MHNVEVYITLLVWQKDWLTPSKNIALLLFSLTIIMIGGLCRGVVCFYCVFFGIYYGVTLSIGMIWGTCCGVTLYSTLVVLSIFTDTLIAGVVCSGTLGRIYIYSFWIWWLYLGIIIGLTEHSEIYIKFLLILLCNVSMLKTVLLVSGSGIA